MISFNSNSLSDLLRAVFFLISNSGVYLHCEQANVLRRTCQCKQINITGSHLLTNGEHKLKAFAYLLNLLTKKSEVIFVTV